MQTNDFIQLLELSPHTPLAVEYLPGMFANKGFEVVSIQHVSLDDIQEDGFTNKNKVEVHLHIRENSNGSSKPLFTKELLAIFSANEEDVNYYQNTEIKVKFGNQDFQTAILDITEVELFQKTFTLKLFFTNQVPKDWKKSNHNKTEEKKKKKHPFSSFLQKLTFSGFQTPKWSPQWLVAVLPNKGLND